MSPYDAVPPPPPEQPAPGLVDRDPRSHSRRGPRVGGGSAGPLIGLERERIQIALTAERHETVVRRVIDRRIPGVERATRQAVGLEVKPLRRAVQGERPDRKR